MGMSTATFSRQARYFQEPNARRIDAIRDEIQRRGSPGTRWQPILLTSLLEAADRVDSTTGLQMAYLKQWAPRSYQRLTLRAPILLPGPGHAIAGDATVVAPGLPDVDLAYLDPPYNQHRYFTNYHVWETLVAWDAPEHYGVACKRLDARELSTRSVFNDRRRARRPPWPPSSRPFGPRWWSFQAATRGSWASTTWPPWLRGGGRSRSWPSIRNAT